MLFYSSEMESCLNKRGFTLNQYSYLEKEALEILTEFIFISEKAIKYAEMVNVKILANFIPYICASSKSPRGVTKSFARVRLDFNWKEINEMYSLCINKTSIPPIWSFDIWVHVANPKARNFDRVRTSNLRMFCRQD